ncbi:hypothetical protein VFPFJ_11063 [Purpureocillium lilacinum]|uniref:Uncharacterized protein n=1 Tax=Purpureocillium lilacinum TaxID=33203 RepID=A0A179FWS1_PURLI|nr:hypothetical protein VFPFJ_11063 [Purpureocillium lilacinum]OAQ69561.1 hypothetical protein VFPFJ_11063 [Purpureocillium lilacinum]
MLAEGGLNATSYGLWASEYSRDGGWYYLAKNLASNPANKSPNCLRINQNAHHADAVVARWACAISRREVRTPLLRTCRRRRLTLEGSVDHLAAGLAKESARKGIKVCTSFTPRLGCIPRQLNRVLDSSPAQTPSPPFPKLVSPERAQCGADRTSARLAPNTKLNVV